MLELHISHYCPFKRGCVINCLIFIDDNLESWKIYEEKKVDCAKNMDMADAELKVTSLPKWDDDIVGWSLVWNIIDMKVLFNYDEGFGEAFILFSKKVPFSKRSQ